MKIHFGKALTIAAFAAFAFSGCGKSKESNPNTTTGVATGSGTGTGTGTGTGSGTGSGTGTGTGSATGGTDAYGRMVNLVWDGGPVDIILNDGTPINTAPFPPGGNTDASPSVGNDYVAFPTPTGSFAYNVKLRNAGGTDVLSYDATLNADVYYTILAVGASDANMDGTVDDPLLTTGVLIDDSMYNNPTSGSHAISIWQGNPGFASQALDVYLCAVADADSDGKTDPCDSTGTADAAGLTFPSGTGKLETTEATTFMTLVLPGVGPMAGYEIPTAADAWSYIYIGINFLDANMDGVPDNPGDTPWVLHHNHGTDNTPIPPVTWP